MTQHFLGQISIFGVNLNLDGLEMPQCFLQMPQDDLQMPKNDIQMLLVLEIAKQGPFENLTKSNI